MTDPTKENTGSGTSLRIDWSESDIRIYGMSSQDVIVTTEDRLHRRLHEHSDALAENRAWLMPLGVLIPVGITLLTAEFNDLIFSSAIWQAIFILVALASVFRLGQQFWKKRKAPTIGDLVESIKETDKGINS